MNKVAFQQLEAVMAKPESIEQSVEYLAEQMGMFLRPQEKMIICFPDEGEGCIGDLLTRAAKKLGAIPVLPDGDYRWKSILRMSFSSRASVIAAPPLVVLGLTKLAKATRTPLYFRNVLTAGYPCLDWMIDGIRRGLDCWTWGCFGPGSGPVVGGFSCGKSRGVHIRDDTFVIEIEDEDGNVLPEGSVGRIVVSPKIDPSIRYRTIDQGRIDCTPCVCGRHSPRLMDLAYGPDVDKLLLELGAELQSWTSILDCKLKRGSNGLELELVTFPGETLPKLPACARQVVRPWDPETDVPNWFQAGWKKSMENS